DLDVVNAAAGRGGTDRAEAERVEGRLRARDGGDERGEERETESEAHSGSGVVGGMRTMCESIPARASTTRRVQEPPPRCRPTVLGRIFIRRAPTNRSRPSGPTEQRRQPGAPK